MPKTSPVDAKKPPLRTLTPPKVEEAPQSPPQEAPPPIPTAADPGSSADDHLGPYLDWGPNDHDRMGTDGAHLDEIALDDEPGGGPSPSARPTLDGAICLSRDEFRASFCGLFNGTSRFTGIQSLAIADGEKPSAEAAADALYDTALEVPQIRFLIQPGNKWVQRAFVVGAFTIPKMMMVRAELAARRAPVDKPKGAGEAAPDPYAFVRQDHR